MPESIERAGAVQRTMTTPRPFGIGSSLICIGSLLLLHKSVPKSSTFKFYNDYQTSLRPPSSEYSTSPYDVFAPVLSFLKWSEIRNATSENPIVSHAHPTSLSNITTRWHSPSDCSKLSLGSQNDWYLSGSWSSLSFMLPPKHSVTLNPSSASSPVNSRLTPPRREPHAAWIRIADVSSLMIVPKLRVLSPDADVSVLSSSSSGMGTSMGQ